MSLIELSWTAKKTIDLKWLKTIKKSDSLAIWLIKTWNSRQQHHRTLETALRWGDCEYTLFTLLMFSFLEQNTPKHNLLILWILSKCWFSHFWIWAPCNQFPNEKQSMPETLSFSDKFSLSLRSISFKVFLMKMNQNSRPLPSPLYKFGKIYFVFLQDLWENPGIQQNGKSSK